MEILSGNNKGTSGTITKVEDNKASIVRDDNKAELVVLLSNLVLKTADYSRQKLKNEKHSNQIKKYDLVGLNDEKTFGVVIALDTENLTIIDISGIVKKVNRMNVKNLIKKDLSVKNKYGQDL